METSKRLFDEGHLSAESYQRVAASEQSRTFSLNWELRTILYLGVLLFTTGLGVLVYENIDTIGHQAILAGIALATGACFYYCLKQAKPYAHEKVSPPTPFFDYILLLGSLLFLIFEGYLQYQYGAFGEHYGLIAILPALLFFFLAYRCDHLGVLSMGLTALAAWIGITVTPLHLWDALEAAGKHLVYTAQVLGIVVAAAGWFLSDRKIKPHFFFSYLNFSSHLLFIATLSGLILAEGAEELLWFLWLCMLVGAGFYQARREKSFYFVLISMLYGYVGLTYSFFHLIYKIDSIIWMGFYYFIFSCGGMIAFMVNHKKILARFWANSSTISTH